MKRPGQPRVSSPAATVAPSRRRSDAQVVRQRDAELGVPTGRRRERMATLRRLFDLFEGNDPAAEIRRLKAEDEGF